MTKRSSPINGSRAIMAGRKEPDDSADFFPTPPWATRALMEIAMPRCYDRPRCPSKPTVWEPACGEGHMAEVLNDYFSEVYATDVHHYGYGCGGWDFLAAKETMAAEWIITNPPFKTSLEFTLRALDLARVGVAMFIRTQWLETKERYERLFRDRPPTLIAFFSERVPIVKGRWDPRKGTATAYCWLIWIHGRDPMPPFWIPPGQRKLLTRPDDREKFAAWSMAQPEAAE